MSEPIYGSSRRFKRADSKPYTEQYLDDIEDLEPDGPPAQWKLPEKWPVKKSGKS